MQFLGGLDYMNMIWVRSHRCGCPFNWFCYQLIAKPGNKRATPLWPDPFEDDTLLYPCPTKLEGVILDSPCPSIRLSVRPSVCRWHGFRSISQVCFRISISNFIGMLMVAIGRSLFIFSNFNVKMAAWWPYCLFLFPDSNFTFALNIISKLQWHNTYIYG